MDSNGGQALITMVALAVARVLQVCNFCITNSRRNRGSESTLRLDDGSGEEEEALRRDSESTLRTDNASNEEYDVFLSFRGPDTRNGFTSCLYNGLRNAGICIFYDNEELKEIAHMVKCTSTSNGKKEILPIFYDVNIDDVKLKTKLYKKAMSEHQKKFRSDELKRWEDALLEVASMKGWDLKGKGYRSMEAIMELLDVRSGGVRFVGIDGMGGVGKQLLPKIAEKALIDLTSHGIANKIKDGDDGINMIKQALSNKEVLIVLDDLDKKEQLKNLAGKSDWFCSGSRIIITTRDESVLMAQVGVFSKEVLNQPEEVTPLQKNMVLSQQKLFIQRGMLPLAVAVIGSNLFDWGKDLEHSDKREVWDETLKKLKEGPFKDVQDTLMISYERLEDKHQEIFLDIACFFITTDKTYPVIMWKDCGYFPSIAMRVLSQRSFIKIKEDNRFWMHDQVRDFGRYIVLQIYPRKFCRVWIPKDALKLLEGKKRNEDVEALSMTSDGCSHSIESKELVALPNLRFFRMKGIDILGNFKNLLLELRWFSWEITHKEFYAKSFHFPNLVVLDLSRSNIQDDWGGWSQMQLGTERKLETEKLDCTEDKSMAVIGEAWKK
ncbi:TMV resistance protein N-like [Eucalyptus grandis]|uniref:TMV resistance protein N-like n=1 Tax=Eucalyptus grandis TaxID=71139 RepID=UPI00192EBB28|nr:TMV resistance protein N-like [Eucalyptus grandis]